MKHLGLWLCVALAACGKKADEAAPSTTGSSGSGATEVTTATTASAGAGSAATGSAVAGSAAPVGSGSAAVAKTQDTRCDDPCRFLVETKLADMAAKVKSACGADWTAATDDCEQLDYQRNCIFADQGYTFKKKKYQTAFGAKSWYAAKADFKLEKLPQVARDNIAELKKQAKSCKSGISISADDQKIVDAWLAKISAKKPDVPDDIDFGMSKESMVEMFKSAYGIYNRKNLTMARYEESGEKGKKVIHMEFTDPTPCPDGEECGGYGPIDLTLDEKGKAIAISVELSACPFVYRVDGAREVLLGEVVRNRAGVEHEATQYLPIELASCSGNVTIRVREEKRETSTLDELALVIDGETIAGRGALGANDGVALTLQQGESADVTFAIPAGARCESVGLRSNGHYVTR